VKKLSIGVPTFNRADCLQECVISIVAAMKGFEDQVELVISNNGSTDGTDAVVQELQRSYPHIRYFKNEVTVLHDIHFPQVLQRSTGEYFWIIGDDDKIEPNAVEVALRRIREGYKLIVTNYSVWSKDFSQKLRDVGFDLSQDLRFDRADDVMRTFGFNLAYISSTIGRREDVLGLAPARTAPYARYYVPFLFSLYASLLSTNSACFIAEAISCNRANNARDGQEYDWFFVYVDGSTAVFNGLEREGYSRAAIREAKTKVLVDYVIFRVFDLKVQNKRIPGLVWRLARAYTSFVEFWLVCLPLLLLPHAIVFRWRDWIWKALFRVKKLHLRPTIQEATPI
jgi:glycosyltransferase involved in cell wall biosynthesis